MNAFVYLNNPISFYRLNRCHILCPYFRTEGLNDIESISGHLKNANKISILHESLACYQSVCINKYIKILDNLVVRSRTNGCMAKTISGQKLSAPAFEVCISFYCPCVLCTMQFPSKKGLRPDHSVGHVHTIAEPKRPEPDARPEVHFGGSPPLLLHWLWLLPK